MLTGKLDIVNLQEVVGWAVDDAQPDAPVSLLIIIDDELVGRVLANRYRADLAAAGIGSGRHSFELEFPKSLHPFEHHVVRVCRESDGADLAESPVVLEPSRHFDLEAQKVLAEIIGRSGTDEDLGAKIEFLAQQLDALLQQLADRDSLRRERHRFRQLLQRWRRSPHDAAGADAAAVIAGRPPRRALVIDDRIPRPDRDAGSLALLSHMESMRRLGYEIVFAPAIEFDTTGAADAPLAAIGVTCCRPPICGSIEELLRRQAGEFDVVYMHRVANASKYGELIRHYNPRARRIYSVADLHHLRFAQQAVAEDRPELMARSQRLRFAEYVAAISADAVITHSTREAEILSKQIPKAKIHTVLWSMTPRPVSVPLAQRRGIAFIGGYNHEPNLDAARWLIDEIMPLVRKQDPDIECFLVGSNMPEQLRRICRNGVIAVGHVANLAEIFDRVRLTVAPLAYGAGVKGKVIESLAVGVPCVCTPVAAEGLELPAALAGCITEGAAGLAALICAIHNDEALNTRYGRAGLDYIAEALSVERLDAAMRRVLGLAAADPRPGPHGPDLGDAVPAAGQSASVK